MESAVSVRSAAAELGVSREALYARIRRGSLLAERRPGPEAYYVPLSEVQRLKNERKEAVGTAA